MNRNRVGTARKLFGSFILLMSFHPFESLTNSVSFGQELTNGPVSETSSDVGSTPDSVDLSPVSHSDFAQPGFPGSDSAVRRLTLTHLIQLTIVASVFLLGYSLLTAGKHGRGWFVMSVMLGIFAVLGRTILSLFVVVADSKSMTEWDEDER